MIEKYVLEELFASEALQYIPLEKQHTIPNIGRAK